MTHQTVDVVVIGAGLGGLTAGALLARAGKSVVVVEAEQQPGGHARALTDGPYTFDRADHLIMGCEPEGPFGAGVVDAVLRHLDVRERCDFIRVDDPVFDIRFPGYRLKLPHGRDAYVREYLRDFPEEAAGLAKLVDASARIYREWLALPMKPGLLDMVTLPWRFPTLFRYRNATMAEVINRELRDPRFKSLYAGVSMWMALPPGRASFVMWSWLMAAYIEQGAYYCRSSFQVLADAIAEGLLHAGGKLLLGHRATRIVTSDRRVRAVELETGEQLTARQVISNIDARETFETLLKGTPLPRSYLRRLRQGRPSADGVSLYLATDLDVRALGASFETQIYTRWDLEESFAQASTGQVTWLDLLIPTLADPTLAPTGEHIVILLTGPASNTPTTSDQVVAERMLELAEQVLPGLRNHITHVAGRQAGREDSYPLHRTNAVYGWEVSPANAANNRLPQRTPISGLLLSGHWTQPGPAVMAVVASGIQAARLALGERSAKPVLPVALPARPISPPAHAA